MRQRPCDGVKAANLWLFDTAYLASTLGTAWHFAPGDYCWVDRDLERLFEGVARMDARQAVERSLAFGEPKYKPGHAAALLRWAEKQKIVERVDVDGAKVWRRVRQGVTFIPRLTLSADVRTSQPLDGGQSIDTLIARETCFRARKLQKEIDWHICVLGGLIDTMGEWERIAPSVFETEGWIIEYAWQLREELKGLVPQLPLYRLIQVVDAIIHHNPDDGHHPSPPELDDLRL